MPLSHAGLLAYLLLTLGLALRDGGPHPLGLALVCLTGLVGVVGLVASRRAEPSPPARLLSAVLVVLWVEAVLLLIRYWFPGPELELAGTWLLPFGVWVVALAGLGLLWATPWLARWRIFLAIALCVGVGAWALVCWREYDRQHHRGWVIDVTYLQAAAAEELLAGRNPYSALYDNIYPDTRFYGDAVIRDGKVVSFPYTPATLAADVVGHALGDVRWPHLFALGLGAVFLVLAARRAGLPPGHPAGLAALLLLLHPCTGKVLIMGWTEPLLFCAVAFCLWTLAGGGIVARSLGVAAVLSAKQYGFLCLPAFWLCGRVGWRELLAGGLLALGLALPFLVWDAEGFWRGVVGFHLHSPHRDDVLSLAAQFFAETGVRLPAFVALGAVVAAYGLHAAVRRPSLAQATFAAAFAFTTFFILSKSPHMNYYWFVGAIFLAAVPLAAAEAGGYPERQEDGRLKSADDAADTTSVNAAP